MSVIDARIAFIEAKRDYDEAQAAVAGNSNPYDPDGIQEVLSKLKSTLAHATARYAEAKYTLASTHYKTAQEGYKIALAHFTAVREAYPAARGDMHRVIINPLKEDYEFKILEASYADHKAATDEYKAATDAFNTAYAEYQQAIAAIDV